MEPSSRVDQYHRNLGWTRQVFSGTGGCNLVLLNSSPALQGPVRVMFPREAVDVESGHVASCKEIVNSGKSCTTLSQVWCVLYGFRFRTWFWLGICLISGEVSSPTSFCSEVFSEFLFMGDHKFLCFWSVTFSSNSARLPCSLRELLEFDNQQKIPVHPDFLRQLSIN